MVYAWAFGSIPALVTEAIDSFSDFLLFKPFSQNPPVFLTQIGQKSSHLKKKKVLFKLSWPSCWYFWETATVV